VAIEYSDLATLHVGRTDEERHRMMLSQPAEVDHLVEHLGKRVVVRRVGEIGRDRAGNRVPEQPARREVHVPDRDGAIERGRLQRAELGPLGDRGPEAAERPSGLLASTACEPVGQGHAVHRPRTRAADGGYLDTIVLEQPVEDAPGERAVSPAALQGQADTRARIRVRHGRGSVGRRGICLAG